MLSVPEPPPTKIVLPSNARQLSSSPKPISKKIWLELTFDHTESWLMCDKLFKSVLFHHKIMLSNILPYTIQFEAYDDLSNMGKIHNSFQTCDVAKLKRNGDSEKKDDL